MIGGAGLLGASAAGQQQQRYCQYKVSGLHIDYRNPHQNRFAVLTPPEGEYRVPCGY